MLTETYSLLVMVMIVVQTEQRLCFKQKIMTQTILLRGQHIIYDM